MTPGMLILTIVLALVALAGLIWLITAQIISMDRLGRIVGGIVGGVLLVIGAGTAWIPAWWLHNTEGGQRSLRNYHQTTHVTSGPTREAKVYSATGQLLATYTGKFDVGNNSGWIDLDIHESSGVIRRVLIDDSTAVITVEDVAR